MDAAEDLLKEEKFPDPTEADLFPHPCPVHRTSAHLYAIGQFLDDKANNMKKSENVAM